MADQALVEQLFSGEPQPFGSLSNEVELSEICPIDFRKDNPWSKVAKSILHSRAVNDISHWQWKAGEEETRVQQKRCFHALLQTFELSYENKLAVAGWMLSEMLVEVPEIK